MVKAYDTVVVVIDPGHGGEVVEGNESSNAGAMYHDLLEKDINLITAKALKDELGQYGNVEVHLTRTEDVEMSLEERVQYAKSLNADVIVSVHYNASADHNFFGSEIFTSAFGECYAIGHSLAECIMDEWVDYGNIRKDIKTRIGQSGKDYYGVIRVGTGEQIPTIILEHGYLDNDKDYLRIKSEDAWRELGIRDARGIAAYFGLEKDMVRASVEPTRNIDIPNEPVMPDDTEPVGVKLVIDNYDARTGDIDFSLYAYDDESKLMYYGFVKDSADQDTVFEELELWTGKDGLLKGSYHVTPGYFGDLTATVFNTYQLNGISNTVKLSDENYIEELPSSEGTDGTLDIYLHEEKEEETAGETEKAELVNEDVPVKEAPTTEEEILGGSQVKNKSGFDKLVVDSIEKNTESTVRSSYIKFLIIGLFMAVMVSVIIVATLSNRSRNRKKRKKRERTSYDWIDD